MTLVTTEFRIVGFFDYRRLRRVWEYTARKHMSDTDIRILRISTMQPIADVKESYQANHYKLGLFVELLEAAPEGEHVAFTDSDMMFCGNVFRVFSESPYFDVALTVRDAYENYPINGGAVYVRNTEEARAFFRLWYTHDSILYDDRREHLKWAKKYAGMNQSSLGRLLETETFSASVIDVPCSRWNACDRTWPHVTMRDSDNPPIIHCKSGVKRTILENTNIDVVPKKYKTLVKLWRQREKEAIGEGYQL